MNFLCIFISNFIRKKYKIFEIGLDEFIDLRMKEYDLITKDDIKSISNNIKIDTIYLLYNKD